jgi:hypothetical protein
MPLKGHIIATFRGLLTDLSLYTGCVSGASFVDELESLIKKAGFDNIRIVSRDNSKITVREWTPGANIGDFVVAASIEAVKPKVH